jgi:homoserine kinase
MADTITRKDVFTAWEILALMTHQCTTAIRLTREVEDNTASATVRDAFVRVLHEIDNASVRVKAVAESMSD